MTQVAWERAMGMRGYLGSPAEKEDRARGIKVGGRIQWCGYLGAITLIEVDSDGDPWAHLTFDETNDEDLNHKDVRVELHEVTPVVER